MYAERFETETSSVAGTPRRASARRQAGFSLIEVSMAIALFAVISISVSLTIAKGVQHRRGSFHLFQVIQSARDLLAEMQDVANQPTDLAAGTGVGSVYGRYHGATFPVPDLPSGEVRVTCYPNETTVPAELGGPQDLNLDGDAADDLGNASAGSDLKLVPVKLDLEFEVPEGNVRLTAHRLVTRTAD